MISKKQLSLISSLHHKKFRHEHGLFIAEGEKVVSDLLRSSFVVKQLYVTKDFYETDFAKLKTKLQPEIISDKELAKISALTTPQHLLAVAEIPPAEVGSIKIKGNLTLLLDDIHDPGNLGTIIRIADWFAIPNVICSETSTDAWSPKVVQACMGSLFRVKVYYMGLEECFLANKLHEPVPVYGSLLDGENIYKTKLSYEGFIVIGNESKGISERLKKYITTPITIPSFSKTGSIDSLNAAMAAAIICSEFRRSR
jgi:RNA methyltransferase, TrmH family